ncbi:MAG: FUSC family protein [Lachnospiraceae bacterium]|nr:FUSC family protein [Lachnospiraceae bacterium]
MNNQTEIKEARHVPHLGQRIIKTAVAVFICLIVYSLRGYEGSEMRTEAAITAIICMQPYVRSSRHSALNRFAGSLIGAAWGLLLLLLLYSFPVLGESKPVLYLLMAAGVMLSLYTSVLVHKTEASALAAIIFLCLVITYPDVEAPFLNAGIRLLDLLIGMAIAVSVNSFRLPRRKNPDYVFFVRSKDLVMDRFAQVSPNVLFRLNALYNDGARICLISEHAPAFFTIQMHMVKLNLPLIVMDGAAIYDMNSNTYLSMKTISPGDSAALVRRLEEAQISFFVYTIHKNRTCIFHHGKMHRKEKAVYELLRRSPYRSYFEEEIYDPEKVVSLKVIAGNEHIEELEKKLKEILPDTLRFCVRPQTQTGVQDASALYVYSVEATVENAREKILDMAREDIALPIPVEIRSRTGYRSENDALRLLHRVEGIYEPVFFLKKRRELSRQA